MQIAATRRRGGFLAVIVLAGLAAAGCTTPGFSSGEAGSSRSPSGSSSSPSGSAPAAASGSSPAPSARCRVTGSGTGASDPAELDRLRAACERALPVVAQMWPDWTGTAQVEVSPEDLAPGTAASVVGLARAGEPARGDRVVVAPGLSEDLSREGLDLVLRHELVHVAMRSTGTAPIPVWASEGIASHVGYAGVADARRERRSELEVLRARVESGSWTGTVPSAELFADPDRRALAYTAAWLGIETLVEQHGWERVVEAMRRPAAATDLDGAALSDDDRDAAFLGSLGVSRRWLQEQWRAELVRRTP